MKEYKQVLKLNLCRKCINDIIEIKLCIGIKEENVVADIYLWRTNRRALQVQTGCLHLYYKNMMSYIESETNRRVVYTIIRLF